MMVTFLKVLDVAAGEGDADAVVVRLVVLLDGLLHRGRHGGQISSRREEGKRKEEKRGGWTMQTTKEKTIGKNASTINIYVDKRIKLGVASIQGSARDMSKASLSVSLSQ